MYRFRFVIVCSSSLLLWLSFGCPVNVVLHVRGLFWVIFIYGSLCVCVCVCGGGGGGGGGVLPVTSSFDINNQSIILHLGQYP